jgi:membrane protein involved in colicin uptake
MTSRILLSVASAAVLTLFTFSTSSAQTSAQDRVDTLRLQLEEVKTKQLDLESRLKLLEQQSQPENIQNSLAGVGSTKPEDLRELKRKQLESEKASVQKQLSVLSESRNRLETGIAQAEARAYQESANGTTTATEKISDSTVTQPPKQRPRRVIKRTRTRRS